MPVDRTATVLVITDHTTATPALLDAIRRRADRGAAHFRLLVPNPAKAEVHLLHPERHEQVREAERALRTSLDDVESAAGGDVVATVSIRHDPYEAVEELMAYEPVDEFIVALAPHGLLQRLHLDLPHRLARLGLPLTEVPVAVAAAR